MKVLFDHQIFLAQKFGGISRYFNEIAKFNGNDISIEKIDLAHFLHQKDKSCQAESWYCFFQ
jgi:hypothetical protein